MTTRRANLGLATADGDDVVISLTVAGKLEAVTMTRSAAASLAERIIRALAARPPT